MMFLGMAVCSAIHGHVIRGQFCRPWFAEVQLNAVFGKLLWSARDVWRNASYSISGQIKAASTRFFFGSVNWSVRWIVATPIFVEDIYVSISHYLTRHEFIPEILDFQSGVFFGSCRALISWLFNRETVLLHRELTHALEKRCHLRANEGLYDCSGWCPHYLMGQCWKEPGDVALSSGPLDMKEK